MVVATDVRPSAVGFIVAWCASTASAEEFVLSPGCRDPVDLVRVAGEAPVERVRMRLVDCDGTPLREAVVELSVLARPYDVDAPEERSDAPSIAPGVVRLDGGLVIRLQAIADRFEGREIHVVSGYRRTARVTSRHRQGRALDLRVDGIARERVVELARALEATGVGYYPNSTFTHIDVRERRFYWVDQSAPGQRAIYVLRSSDPSAPLVPEPAVSPPPAVAEVEPEEHVDASLDPSEVAAFRREVRAQLRAFRDTILGANERAADADGP